MGRHSVTISPINTDAEEVNIRDMSATAKAEFGRDDDDDDTVCSPQTLPPRFRDALNRLNQELHNLDSFFLHRLRSDARRHINDINEQLNIMEDSHRRLYSDFCNQRDQKEELQDRLSQLKDQTEAATQERDQANREIEDLKKTTARLQTSIKDFERDKKELDNPIKDLEDRNESLKAEKEKLEAVIEAKNAEIEALKASPVSAAPRALIEHEASDSLPQSLSLSVPPAHTTPVVADAGDHHTHYKYDQLGFSVTSFLSKFLKIELAYDQSSDGRRLNSVVTEFMFNLGAFADTADVAVSPVEGFWKLRLPWTSKPVIGMTPRPSIEERFVQLCLLIPHLKSRSQGEIWYKTVILINSLMKADHASAPRAGMAFLATMTSTNMVAEVQNLDIQNAALAIALCELCRFLQETFTEFPQAVWDIGNILGSEVQGSVTATPIGRLSACLANLHRSNTLALRRQLATTCGDKFCFISMDRQSGDKLEYGFLSCDDNETFLLLDFGKRSIRFVDRNFAYALHHEDQKKHLLIKRSDGEILLDIDDAAQDVRIFWVKYAERP
ncbi:hypothetical protein B0T24DRAFT_681568 [Lasiosphaeria ovina]|uniref:Uncharacterized protein n=1 Tax=Lasiosphaeria ovina TaxID=92902 RepID=A0AAE0N3I8_9PEZI|nr:hypothetical protein B0T24DRAFT_681568 [Lasiosphaeria ovina]